MNSSNDTGLAKVRIHPFVVVLGAFFISTVGRGIWPARHDWGVAVETFGIVLMVAGGSALLLAYLTMARSRTTIDPRQHTALLVTSGIYRFSRNPIYLGWFLVLLGAGLENGSLLQVLVSVAMIAVLHWAVVLREESYLEARFGQEYVRYREAVRRWL